jgi:phosphoadenosine phosphosulfate reductase
MQGMIDKPEIVAEKFSEQFNKAPAEEILSFFLHRYKKKVVQATSMGAEDQVLTHMIRSIDKDTRIITLDTGRLFQETYDLIAKTNAHFNINIETYFPDYKRVEEMVREKGVNLFYDSVENRKLCCGIRKNEPLKRALQGMDAWICGLRKDQTVPRFYNKVVEWDAQHGLLKVNPLINWTEKQVWNYIRENNIPYNVLHDSGFPSIGCQPCTRAIKPGEDSRDGRWWWEPSENKECGLHNRP